MTKDSETNGCDARKESEKSCAMKALVEGTDKTDTHKNKTAETEALTYSVQPPLIYQSLLLTCQLGSEAKATVLLLCWKQLLGEES